MLTDHDLATAYVQNAPRIRRFLASRLHDPAVADDLTQEVFVTACQDAARYEDRGWPMSAWLYRIAKSRLIDHERSRRRHTDGIAIEACALADDGGIAAALDRVDATPLYAALAQLPLPYQSVIRLRFLDDRALRDVARAMAMDLGTLKALQHRALEALRRAMDVPRPIVAQRCASCAQPAHARGLCDRHYRQWQRHQHKRATP